MKSIKQLTEELKVLLKIAENSKEGYGNIAKNTDIPEFRLLFAKYAAQRASYVTELKNKIRYLGGEADYQNDSLNTFNRTWMNVKAALPNKENRLILEAILNGEQSAVEEYDKVLVNEPYNSELYSLLSEQRFGILKALNIINTFSLEYPCYVQLREH